MDRKERNEKESKKEKRKEVKLNFTRNYFHDFLLARNIKIHLEILSIFSSLTQFLIISTVTIRHSSFSIKTSFLINDWICETIIAIVENGSDCVIQKVRIRSVIICEKMKRFRIIQGLPFNTTRQRIRTLRWLPKPLKFIFQQKRSLSLRRCTVFGKEKVWRRKSLKVSMNRCY